MPGAGVIVDLHCFCQGRFGWYGLASTECHGLAVVSQFGFSR